MYHLQTLFFHISVHHCDTRGDIHSSVANSLLNLGVDLYHLPVEFGVVADHDLRVPTGGDEDGIDTGGDGCGEDESDLEAYKEREGDDNRREAAVPVVLGLCDEEVDVAGEGARVTNEHGTERQNGADEAFLQNC